MLSTRLKENHTFEKITAEAISDNLQVYVDNNGEDCKANLSDII